MQLYFLRHGEADWPGWTKPDDERPLTDFGKKEVRQVAKFINRLKVKAELIVTSPLPRALQTAEVAAEELKTKLRQDEALEPGFGISELRTVVKRHGSKVLMLVGHEPDLSMLVSSLLNDAWTMFNQSAASYAAWEAQQIGNLKTSLGL